MSIVNSSSMDCDNGYKSLDELRENNNDQIESKLALILKKGHVSDTRQVLIMCDTDVASLAAISIQEAQRLKMYVASRLVSPPKTALALLEDDSLRPWRVSTCCPLIDRILKGGFRSGVITEISGESASGKTQLCLQMCLGVQLHESHAGGAVYICTEDVFPSKRLQQMIKFCSRRKPGHKFGDNIFIEHVGDFEGLDTCVEKRLPTLLARGMVQLVVIDSVAALFRCHYAAAQTMERAQHLTRFAGVIHRLAAQHNIPIICVNQVSAVMDGVGSSSMTPALGLSWSNQVSCRIMMRKSATSHIGADQGGQGFAVSASLPTHRQISVVFAPHLPPACIDVYIDDSGIHGIQDVHIT